MITLLPAMICHGAPHSTTICPSTAGFSCCRSQAWEEWTQWLVADDGGEGDADDAPVNSAAGGLMAELQGCISRLGPAQSPRRRALVFCYANNLEHVFGGVLSWYGGCQYE